MRQTQNTQKKDNRKSIFVIALLLLLVAVIGFGGYTLSKYVTKKSETGSASVAKWGYTIDVKADKLFGTDYKFVDTTSVVTDAGAGVTVKSSDVNNRVAPGTTGHMTFEVTGKAEVLSQIKISIAEENFSDVVLKYTEGEDTDVKTYAPVKWTLKKEGKEEALAVGTLTNVKEALAKLYKTAEGKDVATAVNTEVHDKYTLSWAWDFETGNDAAAKAVNNELDTLLGMIANDNSVTANGNYKKAEGTSTEIKFTLDISVVQLKQENA